MTNNIIWKSALSNPVILENIFTFSSCLGVNIPLRYFGQNPKNLRLVCRVWNEMIVSSRKLHLVLQKETRFDLMSTLETRLARWTRLCPSFFSGGHKDLHSRIREKITTLGIFFLESQHVSATEHFLRLGYPNLTELILVFKMQSNNSSTMDNNGQFPANGLPPMPSLRRFEFFCPDIKFGATLLHSIVNASKNLKYLRIAVEHNWRHDPNLDINCYPNLEQHKALETLIYKADCFNLNTTEIARMLGQVSNSLKKLIFRAMNYETCPTNPLFIPKMNNLTELCNSSVDMWPWKQDSRNFKMLQTLQVGGASSNSVEDWLNNLWSENKLRIPWNIKSLKIMNLDNPKILKDIKQVFPSINLLHVGLTRFTESGSFRCFENNKLQTLLETVQHLQLKHLQIKVLYRMKLSSFVKCLTDNVELYSGGLKSLQIWFYPHPLIVDSGDESITELIKTLHLMRDMTRFELRNFGIREWKSYNTILDNCKELKNVVFFQ